MKKIIISFVLGILLLGVLATSIVLHEGDQIWVSVEGQEMTLQQAISTVGLCSLTQTTSYVNTKPNPGHFATEVDFNGKSLQQAINDGAFCGASSTYCNSRNCGSDTCGGYCGPYYNNCGSGKHCEGGQCVNDAYCGDGSCNGQESCSTCSQDCGICYCLRWQSVDKSECNFAGCTDTCGSCNGGCCGGYCLPGLIGTSCSPENQCYGFNSEATIKCQQVPC